MSSAQPLQVSDGLLPLPRPLMTGEVLDAAFRLFRAGLLRCLPYSGLAVLVLELPTLYSTFFSPVPSKVIQNPAVPPVHLAISLTVLLLSAALLGVITLRLLAVSRGQRPRFRTELLTVLRRWPNALIATIGALGLPLLLIGLGPMFNNVLPGLALLVVAVPLLWPTALFVVALPAFWCDGLGPIAAITRAVRISRRQSWRVAGALLATVCMIAVFYVLSAIVVGMLSPMLGRADLFLIATVSSMLSLVVGAFGVPFVLAVLIVAYEDLKLRDRARSAS
jgi:hypothetical protein